MDPAVNKTPNDIYVDQAFSNCVKEEKIKQEFSWFKISINFILLAIILFFSTPLFFYQHTDYQPNFGLINLNHMFITPIHEGGHAALFVLYYLPFLNRTLADTLTLLGGTAAQIIFPLSILIYKYKKKEFLVSFVALWWIGLNLIDISIYMFLALETHGLFMTPFGPTENPGSTDWSKLFGQMGALSYYQHISSFTYWFGAVIILVSLIIFSRYIYQNIQRRIEAEN